MDKKTAADLITAIQELQNFLGTGLSFFAGLSTGIAFVLASMMRWFR